MTDTPTIRRAQFRGVTLSRDDLVAEAMEYLTPYRGARNLEDYPAIMADFAMMIAARVALRMTLPPGYVVVPRDATEDMKWATLDLMHGSDPSETAYRAGKVYRAMIAAATKESEG